MKWPYKPYAWQLKADRMLDAFVNRPLILVAPCGSGKELVVARHALRHALNGNRVLWLTARAYSGEANKRKELEAVLKANGLRLKVAVMRSKPDVCRFAADYAKETGRRISPADVYDLCQLARKSGKCPYGKGPFEVEWTGVVDEGSAPQDACPYYWLKAACAEADIVICDYNYAIQPLSMRAFREVVRGAVLFFDEAHTLHRRCLAAFRASLSARTVEFAVKELEKLSKIEGFISKVGGKKGFERALEALKAVRSAMDRIAEEKMEDMLRERDEGSGEMKAELRFDELMRGEMRVALKALAETKAGEEALNFKFQHGLGVKSPTLAVKRFLERVDRLGARNWICYTVKVEDGKPVLGAALIYPAAMLKPVLEGCSNPLFYSGTLYAEAFKRTFDLSADVLKFRPPFPPECWVDVFTTPGFKVTRQTLEEDGKAEILAEHVCRFFRAAGGRKAMAVMTQAQAERISGFVEKLGFKVNIVKWVPRSERQAYITDWLEGPPVALMSPYSWPAISMDFNGVEAALMVGVPIARMTVEHRAEVEYFAKRLAEKRVEKPYVAAKTWLETVQAMQYHVQANSRARPERGRTIASIWLDERYVDPNLKLRGYVRNLTKRRRIIVEPDFEKALEVAFAEVPRKGNGQA